VTGATLVTVVSGLIPVPPTVIPMLTSSTPAKVKLLPDKTAAFVGAETAELPEPKLIISPLVTPPDARPGEMPMVVIVSTAVTVVPAGMFVPLTGIPTPMPITIPPAFSAGKVSVFVVELVAVALNSGMIYPSVKASRSR